VKRWKGKGEKGVYELLFPFFPKLKRIEKACTTYK